MQSKYTDIDNGTTRESQEFGHTLALNSTSMEAGHPGWGRMVHLWQQHPTPTYCFSTVVRKVLHSLFRCCQSCCSSFTCLSVFTWMFISKPLTNHYSGGRGATLLCALIISFAGEVAFSNTSICCVYKQNYENTEWVSINLWGSR